MKKLIYIGMLSLLFSACEQDFTEVETPIFEVSSAQQTTAVVNEPVDFKFTGNPNIISFYSGEPLNDYDFISGRVVGIDQLNMSFSSRVRFGTQQNQFSVLASTDFNGIYTPENVNAATWIDITNRYALSLGVGTNFIPSGVRNITDVTVQDKPVYIAFKYTAKPSSTDGMGRTWEVSTFKLEASTLIGSISLGSQANSAFTLVQDGSIVDPGRSAITNSVVTLRANSSTEGVKITTYWWAISKPFELTSKYMGPDKAIAIKGYIDPLPEVYSHIYSKPGVYNATFVVANSTIYGEKKNIKTIQINVN